MRKHLNSLMAIGSIALMTTGCMGFKSQYGCSGLPDGIVCKSPAQVYEKTNGNQIGIYQSDETNDENQPKSRYDKKNKSTKPSQGEEMVNLFAKPQFQSSSSPMPVLEQPKVLRIWVAPWKDENETLNWGSYMFTEITPRRWNFGDSVMRNTPITAPNQADYMSPHTSSNNQGDSSAANKEADKINSENSNSNANKNQTPVAEIQPNQSLDANSAQSIALTQ